ncbi:hypothetical protein BWK58_10310 [Flavobacterium columnare]|nr:hypothetical protein BWK58_10310 [Flavobacterium columnare]
MKSVITFDLKSYLTKKSLLGILILVGFGIFAGKAARFTLSEGLCYNGSYQVAFITSFLSLTGIFFGTFFTAQMAMKEKENHFDLIYFSLPIPKTQFLWSRFFSIFSISVIYTSLFALSFFIGRTLSATGSKNAGFHLLYFVLPFVTFTIVNVFLVVVTTTLVSWLTQNKMLVYVSGLLLYVLYMVALVFSGSPFMANQLPQSESAQMWSAILDPFGISAFFYQTAGLSVGEKNTQLLSLTGFLLGNRLVITLLCLGSLYLVIKRFNWQPQSKSKVKKAVEIVSKTNFIIIPNAKTAYDFKAQRQAFFSFVQLNLKYVLKGIPFVVIVLSLLFAVGMEMYAEIEKGIRLPQRYATSGLMLSTIIQNFYGLGVLIMVFYAHDLYWRSQVSRFNFFENSTAHSALRFSALWFTLSIMAILLSVILGVEGMIFQWFYQYPIEIAVYSRLFIFTTFPLLLVGGIALVFQRIIPQRYVALAVSTIVLVLMTTSLGKVIITHPLYKFLYTLNADYSGMNGFGSYEWAFIQRLLFGFSIVFVLIYSSKLTKEKFLSFRFLGVLILGIVCSFWLGFQVIKVYQPKDKEAQLLAQAQYEKQFRIFQKMPQPTIIKVLTQVDLFPTSNAYLIQGTYWLENKTNTPIEKVAFNFQEDFTIEKAIVTSSSNQQRVTQHRQIISLDKALQPKASMRFDFTIFYQWHPVNNHQSFNAIVENGSFMRISRYYPQIGYDSSNEIEDKVERKRLGLGNPTALLKLEEPKTLRNEMIDLEMTITTDANQTAVGVGQLVETIRENNRKRMLYKANQIPFRFAISSADYAVKKERHKGKMIEVLYHPNHYQNVAHLIKNAKITLDYCQKNFGVYPYDTIRFAEISSFTNGFNATAYPATIYMVENMAFHCDITADEQQDVINELAGHELAHQWWGNAQIDPDNREGSPMLTETLAMYTELMLLKKMYGKAQVEKSVAIHKDIYENEKGFEGDLPLIKTTPEMPHISYSKGAVAMYQLTLWIGEEKVNIALRNFLKKYKNNSYHPISTDFLTEVYAVADKKWHKKIRKLFEK